VIFHHIAADALAKIRPEDLRQNAAAITFDPEDWEDYRTKWFGIFGYRQIVLLVGFFSLLFGAVFQL